MQYVLVTIGLISASILNQYLLLCFAKAAGVQYLCKQGHELVLVTIKNTNNNLKKGKMLTLTTIQCNNTDMHKTVLTLAYKKELAEDFHRALDTTKER